MIKNILYFLVVVFLFSRAVMPCVSTDDPKFEGSYKDLAATYVLLAQAANVERERADRRLAGLGNFEASSSRTETFLLRQSYESQKGALENELRKSEEKANCYNAVAQEFANLERYKTNVDRLPSVTAAGLAMQSQILQWRTFLTQKSNSLAPILGAKRDYFRRAYSDISLSMRADPRYTPDVIRYADLITSQFSQPFTDLSQLSNFKRLWASHLASKRDDISPDIFQELSQLLESASSAAQRKIY